MPLNPLESFLKTAETDLILWAGKLEHFVEDEAVKVWDAAKNVITAFEPAIFAQLKGFAEAVIAEVPQVTDLADLEQRVIQRAEVADKEVMALLQAAGSKVLQATIGVIRASL